MKKSKWFLVILTLLFISSNVFSIQVVENKPVTTTNSSNLTDTIVGGVILGMGVGITIGIIMFIIYYIVKKVRENQRKHKDLLFSKFLVELEKCHQNRDKRLKYRNWKTFGFTYKRGDIVLNTKEEGLKIFGKYDGELIMKDSFLLISIYRVTGIFSRERDIIIIPYPLRKLVKKELHNGKYEMIIEAESIDESLNTDYYAQLVIKSTNDDNTLINFNEYIQTEFMEKYIYRQVIKDNLLDYKESVTKAIDMNATLNYEKKNPKN